MRGLNQAIAAVLLFAAALLVGGARAGAAEPIASLPYRIDYGGWFTVEATVNGMGPYDFIIDTGATRTLVFENLAAAQSFPETGGAPLTVLGVSSGAEFPARRIGDIALGDVRVEGLVSVVLPNWSDAGRGPQGLVGLDVLSRYALVFDAAARRVEFHARGSDIGAPRRWRRIALEAEDFGLDAGLLYTLEARMRSKSVRFILDLGAAAPIVNRAGFSVFTRQDPPIITSTSSSRIPGRITDALDVDEETFLFEAATVRAGSAMWRDELFVCHDAEIFRQLGVAERPFGLFGASLFANRSFAIDFAARELRVGPRVAAGAL